MYIHLERGGIFRGKKHNLAENTQALFYQWPERNGVGVILHIDCRVDY